MTRGQRRVHMWLWPLLALGLSAVIFAALAERARVAEAATAVEAG